MGSPKATVVILFFPVTQPDESIFLNLKNFPEWGRRLLAFFTPRFCRTSKIKKVSICIPFPVTFGPPCINDQQCDASCNRLPPTARLNSIETAKSTVAARLFRRVGRAEVGGERLLMKRRLYFTLAQGQIHAKHLMWKMTVFVV